MNAKEKLINVISHSTIDDAKVLNALKSGWKTTGYWGMEQMLALHSFFVSNDLEKAKYHFFECGIIDEFETVYLDEKLLDYGINHLSYALLSDCKELIHRYANLKHSDFDKKVNNGSSTPVFVLQCLIKDDWKEFERAMKIMNEKTAPKFGMELDALFYEALAKRDKNKMEEILAELVSPKIHKKRNKNHELVNEFISHPALGYAKLAWMKGIKVEVESDLIPKMLLPIKPLAQYNSKYDFLKEFKK